MVASLTVPAGSLPAPMLQGQACGSLNSQRAVPLPLAQPLLTQRGALRQPVTLKACAPLPSQHVAWVPQQPLLTQRGALPQPLLTQRGALSHPVFLQARKLVVGATAPNMVVGNAAPVPHPPLMQHAVPVQQPPPVLRGTLALSPGIPVPTASDPTIVHGVSSGRTRPNIGAGPWAAGKAADVSWIPLEEPSWVLECEVARELAGGMSLCRSELAGATSLCRSFEPSMMPGHRTLMQDLDLSGSTDVGSVPECRLVSGSASRQHPAKRSSADGGHIPNADRIFESSTCLVLADGVSQLVQHNIAPDLLPEQLVAKVGEVIESDTRLADLSRASGYFNKSATASLQDSAWLLSVLRRSYDSTTALGATTLVVSALRGGELLTACCGDSGCMILRPTVDVLPFQVAEIFKTAAGRYNSRSPIQLQRLQGVHPTNTHCVIRSLAVTSVPVQPGDVIITASDGIWDNLTDSCIQRVLCQFFATHLPAGTVWPPKRTPALLNLLKEAAKELVNVAIEPWRVELPHVNADDTTAVVAIVVGDDAASSHASAVSRDRKSVV